MDRYFLENLIFRLPTTDIIFYGGSYFWSAYPSWNKYKIPSISISHKNIKRAMSLGLLIFKDGLYVANQQKVQQYLQDNRLTKYNLWYNKPTGRPIITKQKQGKIKNKRRNKMYGQKPSEYYKILTERDKLHQELEEGIVPEKNCYQPNKNHKIRYNRGKNKDEIRQIFNDC